MSGGYPEHADPIPGGEEKHEASLRTFFRRVRHDAKKLLRPRFLTLLLGIVDASIYGFSITYGGDTHAFQWAAFAVAVTSSLTFLGLLAITQNLRDALTGTFIMSYIGVLAMGFLSKIGDAAVSGDESSDTVRGVLTHNLTWVITAVVGFYFAAQTAQSVSDNKHGVTDGAARRAIRSLADNTFDTPRPMPSTGRSEPSAAEQES